MFIQKFQWMVIYVLVLHVWKSQLLFWNDVQLQPFLGWIVPLWRFDRAFPIMNHPCSPDNIFQPETHQTTPHTLHHVSGTISPYYSCVVFVKDHISFADLLGRAVMLKPFSLKFTEFYHFTFLNITQLQQKRWKLELNCLSLELMAKKEKKCSNDINDLRAPVSYKCMFFDF